MAGLTPPSAKCLSDFMKGLTVGLGEAVSSIVYIVSYFLR